MIEPDNGQLGLRRQCELVGLNRSSLYYEPLSETELNLELMRLLDQQYLETPFYGSLRMTAWLRILGYPVNRKRVQRLLRLMGVEAIYPKPHTSQRAEEHKVYPYLFRHVAVTRINQVWSSDITYIHMRRGYVYLVAVMDWFSRYVLAWQLSNALNGGFCLDVLEQALLLGTPEIFNTDQTVSRACRRDVQFTAQAFTSRLDSAGIQISMDGRGRALDNIFNERLWRSVKYENIYIKEYDTVPALVAGLDNYFCFCNERRPHQSLNCRTPFELFFLEEEK